MMTNRKFMFGALIGILCGGFGVKALIAQTAQPPAYLVINTEEFKADKKLYSAMIEAMVARQKGKILAQSAAPVAVDGSAPPVGTVTLIAFENMTDLKAWWNSPFFQGLIQANENTSKSRSYAVEGRMAPQ